MRSLTPILPQCSIFEAFTQLEGQPPNKAGSVNAFAAQADQINPMENRASSSTRTAGNPALPVHAEFSCQVTPQITTDADRSLLTWHGNLCAWARFKIPAKSLTANCKPVKPGFCGADTAAKDKEVALSSSK